MYNFSAGPAQLPPEVLNKAKDEFLDWHGCGMSVMEMPFTSNEFNEITTKAYQDLKTLINLPDNYHPLFLQGGAYAHFSLVAMNLLGKNPNADYVQTGHWSTRAINEAKRYGQINVAASSEQTGFDRVPLYEQWQLNPNAAYCHITTNETANGVQFQDIPDLDVPLVADVTSDFLTRHVDISKFGLIYASAQKNIGPSGLTIVIIRDDLLDQAMDIVPAVFNYSRQAETRINTPSTYSVYMAGLMFSWLLEQGGIEKVEQQNRIKANRLYDLIDNDDFYLCTVKPADRSLANICFELTNADLAEEFLVQSKENGLLNLKGHGVRGGIRASNYNAMPIEGFDALIEFMQTFSANHSNTTNKKLSIA